MTGPDLKVRLLEELDPRLQKVGFARWSDKSGFYGDRYHRWQNSMRQSISPSIIAEGEFLEFGVGQIGLRLDGVEELVRKFEDPVPAALSSRMTTAFPQRLDCGLNQKASYRSCNIQGCYETSKKSLKQPKALLPLP